MKESITSNGLVLFTWYPWISRIWHESPPQSSVATLHFPLRTSVASPDHKLFFNPFLPTLSGLIFTEAMPSVCRTLLHHLCLLKCFPSSDTRSTHPQDVFSLLPSYQHCPNLPLSACSAFYCSRLQACVPHSSVNTSRAELCLIQLFISHLPSNVC